MKPNIPQTKKMGLGVSPDIMKTIAAVKEVAQADNVPSVVFPNSQPTQAESAATTPPAPQAQKARGPRPAPVKRFSVDLPLYTIEQIRQKAHADRCTKRRIILEALREGGLRINDIDLVEPGSEG